VLLLVVAWFLARPSVTVSEMRVEVRITRMALGARAANPVT
jgi:hypothetical protein